MRFLLRAVVRFALAAIAVASWGGFVGAEPSRAERVAWLTSFGDPPDLPFRGTFETGALTPWQGAQCANTGVPSSESSARGTIAVQSDVVGEGRYGARFDLPAATASQACEALSPRPIGVGTDDYYSLMVRFPTEWREPSPVGWGLAIAQLNFQGIWGAPVMLVAHANHVALVLQSGLCKSVYTSDPGCTYSSGSRGNVKRQLVVRAPMARGVWHELVLHVRWATDSSGLIEAWHRIQGSSAWKRTAYVTGYPTVQWTEDTGLSGIENAETNDKIGAYRGRADFPVTVWHDGFVRDTWCHALRACRCCSASLASAASVRR